MNRFVPRAGKFRAVIVSTVILVGTALPTTPASAFGAEAAYLYMGGVFPQVPCPAGCTASLQVQGYLPGQMEIVLANTVYHVTFAGPVAGQADLVYVEPRGLLCGEAGSATGTMRLEGPVHLVARSNGEHSLYVSELEIKIDFRYDRIGPQIFVVVTGGWVNIRYWLPSESGVLTESIGTGYATGFLSGVGAQDFLFRCEAPGPLYFHMGNYFSLTTN